MTNIQREIAQILLKINAVGFVPDNPIMFKSGIKSPVYVDNRKLPFYPKEWEKVILGFEALTKEKSLQFDIIAGIESAGIPHSAALGFLMKKPSVFVRKKIKEHGTKKLVEGGDVNGKQVLLIEDLVTTGSSSLAGVEALREGGAYYKLRISGSQESICRSRSGTSRFDLFPNNIERGDVFGID